MQRAKVLILVCAGLSALTAVSLSDELVGIATGPSCTVAIMRSGDTFESTGGSWAPAGNALVEADANQCPASGVIVEAISISGSPVAAVTDGGYILQRVCGGAWACASFGQTVFQLAGTQPAQVIAATYAGGPNGAFLLMTPAGDVYEENVGGVPAARLVGNVFGSPTATRPATFGQLKARYRDPTPAGR